ncbi:protein IRON-RELATED TRANSCRIPTION FACTOR 2 [Brachypodium distachyon]|uniref:Protein IRON-RELATED TRANSCRIPTION FACTOR 2 n=1 Tax=Brachypodium distachyon TaxID=15368 RepID=I1HVA7_BRADI|nr:protein IRON-RELATED TRANSCRIPTION FACTOR 2 [Brachypodium distachyon]KQK11592.1 hypothetical protein BRADI_2g61050v3 [Brachypodium distachyon]|eukprot:XP_003565095.1 protein IRON-RELATED TRANSCRIPTION FACTOR 2 [Brachypodium distachyon]
MGHKQLFVDDPFASSISSLEAEAIFSGAGGQWRAGGGLDDRDLSAMPAAANTSSGGSGSPGGGGRKMSHNAYERDRRKQLNELYSSLRSLLPDADHTKKLSIPITVSRVLKYIPELQKEVDGLERKKEELTRANCKPGVIAMKDQNVAPVVSATCLDDKDIMVQVSLLSGMAAAALPMSTCIKILENEGLRLVSSSTSAFGNRTFYNLHLQRNQRTMSKECPAFCDELEKAIKKKAGLHMHQ